MMRRSGATLFGLIALTACATSAPQDPDPRSLSLSRIDLGFVCEPAGATIYHDGTPVGRCEDARIPYKLTAQDNHRGFAESGVLRVQWQSGVAVEQSIRLDYANGALQYLSVVRPINQAGLEADQRFAIQYLRDEFADGTLGRSAFPPAAPRLPLRYIAQTLFPKPLEIWPREASAAAVPPSGSAPAPSAPDDRGAGPSLPPGVQPQPLSHTPGGPPVKLGPAPSDRIDSHPL